MDLAQEARELTKRFFFVKEAGGQKFYYDSETGDRDLTYQHLAKHLIDGVLKRYPEAPLPNVVGRNSEGFQAITHQYFQPVLLHPIYQAGSVSKVVELKGNLYPNSWREPEVKPTEFQTLNKARAAKGAGPFIEHLQRMLHDTTTDLDDENSKAGYLISMLAYRYQVHDFREKQKPHVSFYFYGKQGYGKGVFADTLQAVFGQTAIMKVPDEKSLDSMSSVDIFSRTWAVVDEVNIAKGSTNYNKIKTHTGTSSTNSARKGEHFKKWYIPAQLIMFSQKPPTFIEPGDRRFFISEWDCEFQTATEKDDYFYKYTDWLQNQDGYAKIAGLLSKTDITKVRPEAPAMITPEKTQIVAMVTDDSVTDIKLIVGEAPACICFTEDSFEKVWNDYGISKSQRSYKLQEAGLVETEKKKYEGRKNRKFFLREGYELKMKNGMKAELIHRTDKRLCKFLDQDVGYMNAMGAHHKQVEEFEFSR